MLPSKKDPWPCFEVNFMKNKGWESVWNYQPSLTTSFHMWLLGLNQPSRMSKARLFFKQHLIASPDRCPAITVPWFPAPSIRDARRSYGLWDYWIYLLICPPAFWRVADGWMVTANLMFVIFVMASHCHSDSNWTPPRRKSIGYFGGLKWLTWLTLYPGIVNMARSFAQGGVGLTKVYFSHSILPILWRLP